MRVAGQLRSTTIRAKICGIRSEADLRIAVDAGTDAIGLICGITHVSEDEVTRDLARHLVELAPPFVSTVLVTHLEDAGSILELADHTGVDTIQIHGLVDLNTVKQVRAGARGRRILKAVHVGGGKVEGSDALSEALQVAPHCDALLLDTRTGARLGGTGRTHDWSVSRRIVEATEGVATRVVLAGGLTPENVGAAVRQVRPYAVDVNSGVENPDGSKSLHRCRDLIRRAKGSDLGCE